VGLFVGAVRHVRWNCALDSVGLAQGLSTDTRPEVRNSGVRTLFAVVASQGTRLSHSAWEECLWQMLFPLLRSVHHTAATSSREEVPPCPCLRLADSTQSTTRSRRVRQQ
jgi:hypothetical protein